MGWGVTDGATRVLVTTDGVGTRVEVGKLVLDGIAVHVGDGGLITGGVPQPVTRRRTTGSANLGDRRGRGLR